MEFGFTPEGEKLTPQEELKHALETYGSPDALPENLKDKLIKDFGGTTQFEDAVASQENPEDVQDLMNVA